MKILLADVETAPSIVHVWGLWNQNIGINQIVDSGYTLCWSAKWLGEKEIMFSSIHRDGNKKMLKAIHKLLDAADVVVTYNGNKFDVPVLNKEFIKIGLNPPSPYKQVDLLRVARSQFRFTSNKLDYVAKFLGLGTKVKHKGHDLWTECMAGDEQAWRKMETYNIGDIKLLERVYKRMLPWIPNHPNQSLYGEFEAPVCPTCGSKHVQRRGTAKTKTGIYHRFVCNDCGTWSRSRYTLVTKEQRENILVNV